jgi:ubiquinone biosynthesis protein
MAAKSLPAEPRRTRRRLALRALAIGLCVTKHWLRWWVGWTVLLLTFSGRARRKAFFGAVILDLFRELGATFIKVGQIMSTRPDLIPEHVSRALEHLQDDVGPFPFEAVVQTLETDFGRPMRELFAEFAPVPLASASVSQVHKARLPGGRIIAVKVRRPNVIELCTFDLAVMRIGARLLNAIPSIATLSPVATVEEFGRAVFSQLDFRIEARNNRRFRENFRGHPNVVFPEIIDELSSERVLSMSFVEGTKILAKRTRSDPKRVARLGLQALLKMIFEDGFVHADLHPGNMMVQDDGTLIIFDAGLAKLLHEDVLIQFIDMSKCIAMGTADDLLNHLRRFHKYVGDIDWASLRVEVEAYAMKFRGQDMAKLEYGELIGEMFALGRKYHVRPVTDMMLVFVALITAQGIGKMLEPEHNVFGAVAQYLIPILMKRNESVPDTDEAKAARG